MARTKDQQSMCHITFAVVIYGEHILFFHKTTPQEQKEMRKNSLYFGHFKSNERKREKEFLLCVFHTRATYE